MESTSSTKVPQEFAPPGAAAAREAYEPPRLERLGDLRTTVLGPTTQIPTESASFRLPGG